MVEFVYYNRNPDGNKESDCVTRAISLATGLSYPTIRNKLFHSSKLFSCHKLNHKCYSALLEKVFEYTTVPCRGLTVAELSSLYRNDILLIRIDGHLTCSYYGKIYDIWDCRDSRCDVAWIIK